MKTAALESFPRALARQIQGLRRRYRRRLERCQHRLTPAGVHELRIATRRMLTLTELLKTLGIGKSPRKIWRTFKRRLDAFDALRDIQVQQTLLAGHLMELAGARDFGAWLARRERKLIKQLRREVKQQGHDRLDRWLKRAARDLKRLEPAATRVLPLNVAQAVEHAFAVIARLRPKVRADRLRTIHQLRIAFKHHRYLCELLHLLWPPLASINLKAMHRFQTLMGEIQDCEVLLAGLRAAVKSGAVTARAVGPLRQLVLTRRTRRAKMLLERIERVWEFQPSA